MLLKKKRRAGILFSSLSWLPMMSVSLLNPSYTDHFQIHAYIMAKIGKGGKPIPSRKWLARDEKESALEKNIEKHTHTLSLSGQNAENQSHSVELRPKSGTCKKG